MFKYLLSINEDKYPEVVQKLEKAKERDGIALYIRQLIEKDLQSTPAKQFSPVMSEIAASSEDWPKPEITIKKQEQLKPKRIAKVASVNVDTDFGGGLA